MCWIFTKCVTISDITTYNGTQIHTQYSHGNRNTSFRSNYKWPESQEFISTTIRYPKLTAPIGKWIPHPQYSHWLQFKYDAWSQALYRYDNTNWYCYGAHTSAGSIQCLPQCLNHPEEIQGNQSKLPWLTSPFKAMLFSLCASPCDTRQRPSMFKPSKSNEKITWWLYMIDTTLYQWHYKESVEWPKTLKMEVKHSPKQGQKELSSEQVKSGEHTCLDPY